VGGTLAPARPQRAPRPHAPVAMRCQRLDSRVARPMCLPKILDSTSNAYCGITNNIGARESVLQLAGVDIGAAYSRCAYWSPSAATGSAVVAGEAADKATGKAGSATGAQSAAGGSVTTPTDAIFLSDAGGADLAALLPMLQRSAKRIVAFTSFGVQITTTFPIDGGASGTEWQGAEGDIDANLPAYFGIRARTCEHIMHALKNICVFEPSDFWRLMRAARQKILSGDFPIVELEQKVLPNAFWGIKGGYTVRMCWVILQRVPQWEARLPKEVREQVERDCESQTGEFRYFPNYLVSGQVEGSAGGLDMHLTVKQAHLSSQLASAYVMEHADVFKRMLGPRSQRRGGGPCGS